LGTSFRLPSLGFLVAYGFAKKKRKFKEKAAKGESPKFKEKAAAAIKRDFLYFLF
jgi:hypothetical protein